MRACADGFSMSVCPFSVCLLNASTDLCRPLPSRPQTSNAVPRLRSAAFGANKFKAIPPKSFFKLWFGNLRDPTLIMLMAAAMVRCRTGPVNGCPPPACAASALAEAGPLEECMHLRARAWRQPPTPPTAAAVPCQLNCHPSCTQISTILGVAVPAEREDSAWSEGVAIWVAVLVVSLVGECRAAATRL